MPPRSGRPSTTAGLISSLTTKPATAPLCDAFRARLDLPDGQITTVAAVPTFGDYLIFHPHLHVLAADGLFDKAGRFHCMPSESAAPVAELLRHRLLHALREAKLISPRTLADLLAGLKVAGTLQRPEEIEFFPRMARPWEGLVNLRSISSSNSKGIK